MMLAESRGNGLPPAVGEPPLRIAIGLAGLALGGAQINAIDLAQTLRGRGHDVSLFGVRDDSVAQSVLPYAVRAGFDIDIVEAIGLRDVARAITRYADGKDAQIVHVFAPWLGRIVAVASATWSGRAGVETNWNMENMFWGSPHVPLIVGTGVMADEARARIAAPVYLMEPPVDLRADKPDTGAAAQFRAQHGIAQEETLICVVTRVDRAMKGESLLQAIAAVESLDGGLRLAIVGDGDAFESISEAAAAANTRLGRDAVLMTGTMQDPRPAYAAADIVLGMGGSAIRALAHGKPLVVLGKGGFALTYEPSTTSHFRREGFYGIGSDSDPVVGLARQIRALHDDPDRRARLRDFSLQEAVSRFGLDAAADSLEGIYRSALASPPRRATRLLDAARLSVKARAEIIRSRRARGGRR